MSHLPFVGLGLIVDGFEQASDLELYLFSAPQKNFRTPVVYTEHWLHLRTLDFGPFSGTPLDRSIGSSLYFNPADSCQLASTFDAKSFQKPRIEKKSLAILAIHYYIFLPFVQTLFFMSIFSMAQRFRMSPRQDAHVFICWEDLIYIYLYIIFIFVQITGVQLSWHAPGVADD
jgi:hypothetical protein